MNEREEFEAWCKSIGYCLLKDDDAYDHYDDDMSDQCAFERS